MATNTLNDRIKTIQPGEDGDEAYRRLYADQVKPCDFRRWFSVIKRDGACVEIDAALSKTIGDYVADVIGVDEAFKDYCPVFVGPGEFGMAYEREMRERKAVKIVPVAPPAEKGNEPVVAVEKAEMKQRKKSARIESVVSQDDVMADAAPAIS